MRICGQCGYTLRTTQQWVILECRLEYAGRPWNWRGKVMDIRSEDETWFEVFDMAHQKNRGPS
jgi:hypothetical protein